MSKILTGMVEALYIFQHASEVNSAVNTISQSVHPAVAVFYATPYPFLLLAVDLTILDKNEAYARTTGKSRGELGAIGSSRCFRKTTTHRKK